MRLSAALIVKNAEDTLPACLESLRPHVDEIVIVDTGSTDRSPEIARLYANRWELYTGCNVDPRTGQQDDKIWDFSAARNKSFELVTGDVVAWIDADDIITGTENLRRLASELPDGPGACLIPYEYSYADAECTLPTCIHWRERLIKHPAAFHWTTPCHEVCVPKAGMFPHTQSGEVVIKHRAQQSKNPREPQRNLRILTAYLQRVGEGDPRAMYYCGVEYARHGMFGKAREILRRYVELGNWTDEKCLAELELARILLQEGDCKQALEWADRALNTKSWPDPYWLKAKTFWRMAIEGSQAEQEYNLRRAHTWAERGRPLEDAQTVLFYNPQERFETERIVNRIAAHFGKVDEAAEACRRGLAGMPGDPELMEQLRGYEAVRIGREIDLALERLVHLGKIDGRVMAGVQRIVATNELPANENGGRADGVVAVSTLPAEFGGGQIPRYQIAGGRIIIGGPVIGAEDWASLQALGITHVCSVTDPPDVGVPADVSLHSPVPDEGEPFSDEQLDRVVGFAADCLNKSGNLYLHCWVGASRSPGHAFAVLRAVFGMPAQQALAMIQAAYPYQPTFGTAEKHQAYVNGIEQWLVRRAQGPFARIGTGAAVDAEALPAVPEGKLDIVIFTGPAFEDWTPATIAETGIGGSETMAWEMARGLARLGHRVRHYGWCKPEQEGVFDGVYWYDASRYRDIACDVLVVSRYADGVQCVGGVKARARVLYIHDVHCGAALTPEHAGRFDRFLCLSEWHKAFFCQTYAFIDPDRVQVTRNGIDLKLFEIPYCCDDTLCSHAERIESAYKRNPLRAVYSSSPDRGLQTALDLWPLIRAEVPDAELHVFYGFAGLAKTQPALADALEAKARVTPGVVLRGRVKPRELARNFMQSGVWFYPTWFSETSCITAMQAQAAGLRIVTSPIAALNETVGHRGTLIDGAPGPIDLQTQGFVLSEPSAEYRSACVAAVVKALTDPDGQGEREAVQYAAKREFALEPLCDDWSRMLTKLVASVDSERVSRFYVAPEFEKAGREVDEENAA